MGSANRVNDAGIAVGGSVLLGTEPLSRRAFVWDAINGIRDIASDLGTSIATSINEDGVIVGHEILPDGTTTAEEAVLWLDQGAAAHRLNALIPSPGDWKVQGLPVPSRQQEWTIRVARR